MKSRVSGFGIAVALTLISLGFTATQAQASSESTVTMNGVTMQMNGDDPIPTVMNLVHVPGAPRHVEMGHITVTYDAPEGWFLKGIREQQPEPICHPGETCHYAVRFDFRKCPAPLGQFVLIENNDSRRLYYGSGAAFFPAIRACDQPLPPGRYTWGQSFDAHDWITVRSQSTGLIVKTIDRGSVNLYWGYGAAWECVDDAGAPVPAGHYGMRVHGTSLAGNSYQEGGPRKTVRCE